MKPTYQSSKFLIDEIIKEIYADNEDEDGFAMKLITKKDIKDEIMMEFSEPDPKYPNDPKKRKYKISPRTAYRWIEKHDEEFGHKNQKTRRQEIHDTIEKISNNVNQNLKSISNDPRITKINLAEIKDYTDVLQKLQKLLKSYR
tara:strand:+ start:56 stop:487 length:432 start_codon:yes stop_codon:yes gene_type:complete